MLTLPPYASISQGSLGLANFAWEKLNYKLMIIKIMIIKNDLPQAAEPPVVDAATRPGGVLLALKNSAGSSEGVALLATKRQQF